MKNRRAILYNLIILLVAGVIYFPAPAQQKHDARAYVQTKADELDKLISIYAEYGKFDGSVLVAEKGKVIYKKGIGLADMEWNVPNQPDTKFRLGSITKQFTSMLIIQLVEQGKLKLDVPISAYLPDYPKKNVMMERSSRTLKVKRGSSNVYC